MASICQSDVSPERWASGVSWLGSRAPLRPPGADVSLANSKENDSAGLAATTSPLLSQGPFVSRKYKLSAAKEDAVCPKIMGLRAKSIFGTDISWSSGTKEKFWHQRLRARPRLIS